MSRDAKRTRDFAIKNKLINYCGQLLTPDVIDRIFKEIVEEMEEGPCSWAFPLPFEDEPK